MIVFGAAHGEQAQAALAFAEILGAQVIAAPGLDTDQFGTFTGDVVHTLSLLSRRLCYRPALCLTGR